MADGKPGRGSDQFPLRLPDGMRNRIRGAAEINGRSMNTEIVARLEASFKEPVELLWYWYYPDVNLTNTDIDQLRHEIGPLIKEYRRNLEESEDIFRDHERDYLLEIVSIMKGVIDPTEDDARRLGAFAALRYKRISEGGLEDNPFGPNDARHAIFQEGFRQVIDG